MHSSTFAALGDPTRVAIIDQLSRGAATVTEIAAPFDMSLRGVLKHVQVLEEAGLVRTEKSGRVRRCVLQRERLDEAQRWMHRIAAQWERRMDRMDQYLAKENIRR